MNNSRQQNLLIILSRSHEMDICRKETQTQNDIKYMKEAIKDKLRSISNILLFYSDDKFTL